MLPQRLGELELHRVAEAGGEQRDVPGAPAGLEQDLDRRVRDVDRVRPAVEEVHVVDLLGVAQGCSNSVREDTHPGEAMR